jgi:hypothetical protein
VKLKYTQYNGQEKKDNRSNNYLQNTTSKTTDTWNTEKKTCKPAEKNNSHSFDVIAHMKEQNFENEKLVSGIFRSYLDAIYSTTTLRVTIKGY